LVADILILIKKFCLRFVKRFIMLSVTGNGNIINRGKMNDVILFFNCAFASALIPVAFFRCQSQKMSSLLKPDTSWFYQSAENTDADKWKKDRLWISVRKAFCRERLLSRNRLWDDFCVRHELKTIKIDNGALYRAKCECQPLHRIYSNASDEILAFNPAGSYRL
jgi:hypothetical protein